MNAPLGDRLIIASHNAGKVREIADLVQPFGVSVQSASDLNLVEPDETGSTFIENALIKAHAASSVAGLPALSDDSGLAVDLLDGAPGIYSARLAGPTRDFDLAMDRLRDQVVDAGGNPEPSADKDSPTAKFICALALAWPDGQAQTFVGEVSGALVWPPRGERGFGYDPIFQPTGHTETFGEMDPTQKHQMSHRADAFRKLVAALFGSDD